MGFGPGGGGGAESTVDRGTPEDTAIIAERGGGGSGAAGWYPGCIAACGVRCLLPRTAGADIKRRRGAWARKGAGCLLLLAFCCVPSVLCSQ